MTKATNDTTEYTATFTLTQIGKEGPVTPSLEFIPLIEDPSESPAIFECMAHVYLNWLKMMQIIDENGEVIDQEYLDQTDIRASAPSTKH